MRLKASGVIATVGLLVAGGFGIFVLVMIALPLLDHFGALSDSQVHDIAQWYFVVWASACALAVWCLAVWVVRGVARRVPMGLEGLRQAAFFGGTASLFAASYHVYVPVLVAVVPTVVLVVVPWQRVARRRSGGGDVVLG